jgi:hypothetical protein
VSAKPARRWFVRVALPLVVPGSLLALYVLLIAPLQRTLWIISNIHQAGFSSSVHTKPAGPQWLRDVLRGSFAQGLSDITAVNLVVDNGGFNTEQFLTYLAPHGHVESLGLNTRRAYDDEFGRLDCLPHLKSLRLTGAILTDDGMQHLRRCQALTRLRLKALEITDAGIAPIESLKSLEELDIRNCPAITDEALRYVSRADGIRTLRVSGPGITDKSLPFLAGMKHLTTLDVVGTGITTEGATWFITALPQCTIIWSDGETQYSNRLVNGLGG